MSNKNPILLIIFVCLIHLGTIFGQPTNTTFSFTLPSTAITSAGVYNADSTLVRTLWSSIRYIGGTHVEKWDGLLDNRDTAPTGNYHIKVLSHNVHYSWDGGRIGNTSTALTGDSRFKSYLPPQCVAIAANRLYYGTDYQERESSQYYVDLNDLGTKYRAVTNEGTNQVTRVNCTDGNNVYWGGLLYPLQGPATGNFVFATKASDNSLVSFANGESGYRFYSAIATSPELDNVNNITSLAVQTTGNYLFVVRSETNELRVVNKTTGAFVRNITINNVYTVATDTSGKLWVATTTGSIIKYTVNGNGTLTSTGIAATGVGNAAAMTVSPDNSTLVVADNAPYVVKGFNNSAGGTAIWTLGTPGGYTTDATITNYKFDFGPASIAFQPDGSFWVLDGNNSRFQHYSSSRVFLNSISYLSSYYQTHIDPNNKNRLFASSGPNVFLEYELDYTKTLDNGQNGSWKLAKNWKLPTGLSGYYFNSAIPTVVSFAGRTFTRIKNDNTGLQDVYELVAGGQLRKTKINFASTTYFLNNGDRLENINGYAAGIAAQYKLYAFTGFDGDNDPLWTSTPYKTFNSPVTTTKDAFSGVTGEQLSNNTIYYFRNDAVAGGSGGEYHLSAFDINTSQWKFKTSIGTHNYYLGDFPNEGQFDNGNYVSRAGAYMTVNGTNLVWSYAGEFWKNEQTNYFNHFHTSGLFIGLFGRARDEFPNQIGQEGNMFSGSWVQDTPDRAYLFSGGEGKQGGIHRWRIEGLSTIQVQNCNFNPSLNYTPAQPDLMVGLIHLQQLTNGNGWTISNPSTSSLGNPAWNVLIGKQTPSLYGSQDISIYYYQNNGYDASQNRTVTRTLGTNTGLNTWKISGKISYQGGSIVGVIGGGTYFEMLDNTGKVIARLYEEEASRHSANRYIKGNGTELHAYISLDEHRTVSTKFQPFEISNNNGTLTFQYATYAAITTAIAETGADITKPTTIRLRFTPGDYQKAISIAELQFAKDTINHYRTQQSGDWADLDTWESSADSITWNDATEIPNSSANSITIRTGHTIAITGSAALDQLTIQNGAAINVAPKASLWINDGEGDDIKIVGTGKLTIQSDSSGTGRIGNSIGNINGNVVVEKYIASKNNKAYHLLAPSVNTVGGPKPYIRDNWQEGQNNTSVLTNSNTVPGYGTHITGSLLGNNGFDANALAISSLFIYNQSAASPGFVGIANTNATNLEAKKGYLLYVRGDRSIDLQTNLLSSNTTLRATGTVLIGTQTFTGLESNGRLSLVTNPYASSVNWNTIYTDASTANSANFENYCTYWDPNIGESGGYVNISVNGTKSNADNKTTEIPSGEAFFVKAKSGVTAPTFTVKESHKSSPDNLRGYRTAAQAQFATSLHYSTLTGRRIKADAVNAVFDSTLSASVDGNDAEEIPNENENVALIRDNKMLGIETRPLIGTLDTLFLRTQRLKIQQYEWQFQPVAFNRPNLRAYLEDKFLNTRTEINLADSSVTVISFIVTAVTGSDAADRFRVVFNINSTLPVTLFSLQAYQNAAGIAVDWTTRNEYNIDRYEIEKSLDGRQFIKQGTILAKTTGTVSNFYTWPDSSPKEGNNYYRIKTVDKNGKITYSEIVNVKIGLRKESFEVYPNPLTGKSLIIQFNNIKQGNYTISMINTAGQKIYSKKIEHRGGSASQSIIISNELPTGIYNLQVTGNGIRFNQRIMKE